MKPDINRKYQEEISYKLAQRPNKLNSAEKEWIDFKDIIQGTAGNIVGQKKYGGQQNKATAWWNEKTRQATKLKKAIIQEVAERSNTTEQRTVSVSQRCMQISYQTGQRKGMVRVW